MLSGLAAGLLACAAAFVAAPAASADSVWFQSVARASSSAPCPDDAFGTPWLKRLAPYRTGFASGWMGAPHETIGGRAAKYDRGFTLSDHADWPSLLRTIAETGARRVLTMHGDSALLIELLRARGLQADALDLQH